MGWFVTNRDAGYIPKPEANARDSLIDIQTYIWDHSDGYVDWQLASPNTSTMANDAALGALTKYTDGYAMKVKGKIYKAYCVANQPCGFCLHADDNGSSCVLWMNPNNGLNLTT